MTLPTDAPASTYTVFASGPEGGFFVEKTLELPTLGRNDVAISIICCSVCYTDTMIATQAEGQIAGHECIGRVDFKGEDVTNIEIGDIVGLGYIRSTCLQCSFCLSGQEHMCPKIKTFVDGIGGFANASIWDSRFVYKIPESIEPRHAGPLTCAGASVFGALYGYNVSPTSTVGVVGLGGLGHLAIKFSKAWGCKVVAISSTREKEQDAYAFGAHEFIYTKDPITTSTKMDYIINTVAGDLPWGVFVNLLESNGTLINMGVCPKDTMEIPYIPVLFKQLRVVGSLVAPRHVVKKMFDFAALHNIRPEIEELEMSTKGCREACRRVIEQRARYRVVLNVPERLAL
ncbi:hypothetical protein BC939DRAFT_480463 [Gamsiella multidivaricata]|uniref:uncharacterized protein n=1 Tax=Gamsiella multidivaricata TaxID=101098 RepID=UPI00221F5798|nr:uncharacterized protein BC939DRAFT_480463 [Gamsiella multidivaricata]KAG0361876.1 hypothetical protein BGZ54_008900 [Gamsiella multidivaricata]KAI7818363.1 hypothetical protein BC939DRAFT_480463 [Gamsiella multidivaricata]